MSETKKTGLELLREPFPPNQISKLCRSTKRDNQKGRCSACGGWHGLPAIQLDYVGHAALTDRLLDADANWTWEPLAVGPNGYPVIDEDGGMWIKLTVAGVTRLGYGDAQGKIGGDAMKERIGDALRNAAMRFGAALDLWHKGDLHATEEEPEPQKKVRLPALSDEEGAIEYKKWMEVKSLLIDGDGDPDQDRIANEWGKLASNVRTAIKKHGESVKVQEELDKQASEHMKDMK